MRQEHIIKILQEPVDIPDIVQERAQEAFAAIHQERQRQNRREVPGSRRKSRKRLWLTAAAAAVLVGTVSVGAAVYQRWWSKGLEETLHASEEQMQEMDGNGVSSAINQAVIDQGVTITAVQSIVDKYYAHLAFKVEGFDLPEGAEPAMEKIEVTVDGENEVNWVGGFYDGLVAGEDGNPVYSNGEAFPGDGSVTPVYVDEDGSLEFQLTLEGGETPGNLLGRQVQVKFVNLGMYEEKEFVSAQEGRWEFNWILQGTDQTRACSLDTALGESGVTVREVEISPISLKAVLEIPEEKYGAQGKGEESAGLPEAPGLSGVVLKDGTTYPYLFLGPGFMSEQDGRTVTSFAIDRILDVEQVDNLLFTKEMIPGENTFAQNESEDELPLEDRFYVVPLES